MNKTRPRGDPDSLVGAIAAQPHEEPLDDWLGDISDDDWSEIATERAERRRATPSYLEPPVREEDFWRDPTADLPAGRVAAAEAHRAIVARRRLVAGLALVVVLALAVVIPVLLLRSGGQAPVAPVPEAASATPRETSPSSTPTTPSATPLTTPPSTMPSTRGASTFTLPEGTKLQRGEGDPAVIRELQHALSRAGYDPGPADGRFGRRTEEAVVALQQANGLSVDGDVGPETVSALNSVVAGG